jgi:hypothetical protein
LFSGRLTDTLHRMFLALQDTIMSLQSHWGSLGYFRARIAALLCL